MIEKITDFGSLGGVSSPLLPLVFADGYYSSNDLDGVFVQKAENGEEKAVFSLKNTCVTLILISDDGSEELQHFFSFCGVTEILSNNPITQFSENQKELYLFEFNGKVKEENKCLMLNLKSTISEYEYVYNVVFEHGNNFENWFPDFSKKINSFNAFATYLKANEKAVSVAISPAVFGNTAVIAGVQTLKEFRNKGYASECINALLNEFNNNKISKIYLWCEEKNIEFYRKLSFKNIGKIYIGECT